MYEERIGDYVIKERSLFGWEADKKTAVSIGNVYELFSVESASDEGTFFSYLEDAVAYRRKLLEDE